MDPKIVQVALSGLENILKIGVKKESDTGNGNSNPYANVIEECFGLDKIEFLQSHENMEIYQKAFDIIETYFGSEEDDDKIAPSVDPDNSQYNFNPPSEIATDGTQQLPGFQF